MKSIYCDMQFSLLEDHYILLLYLLLLLVFIDEHLKNGSLKNVCLRNDSYYISRNKI